MDFASLLAKADSNVRKLNRKVHEAEQELESERRRKLVQLNDRQKNDKTELKRRIAESQANKQKVRCVRLVELSFYFSEFFSKADGGC